MTIIEQCRAFLNNKELQRHWVKDKGVQIYFRKSNKWLNDGKVTALEIGNIDIKPTGQGIFTNLIREIHVLNPYDVTFVQNVNPRFRSWFIRNFWEEFYQQSEYHYYLWTT